MLIRAAGLFAVTILATPMLWAQGDPEAAVDDSQSESELWDQEGESADDGGFALGPDGDESGFSDDGADSNEFNDDPGEPTGGSEQGAVQGYCESVADGVWAAAAADLEQQALAEINGLRQRGISCGGEAMPAVAPLTMETRLQCAARNHSKDLGTQSLESHMNPNEPAESSPYKRAFLAGFPKSPGCGMPGPDEACVLENISWGHTTAASVVHEHWVKSPGHCKNLMSPNDDIIGIGHYADGFWTLVIGKREN